MDETNVTIIESTAEQIKTEKKHLPPITKEILKYFFTFLLIGALSVSYTHLDVYKRQTGVAYRLYE